MGDRGAWASKWASDVEVDPEKAAASLEALALKRVGEIRDIVLMFRAAADSELSWRSDRVVSALRVAYLKLWRGWVFFDVKHNAEWGLADYAKEGDEWDPKAKHYKAARSFELEEWIGSELPRVRALAGTGVRALSAPSVRDGTRPRRRRLNAIVALLGKELDYIDWALQIP